MEKYRHGRSRIMMGIISLLFCCVLSHLVIPHHCRHSTFCVTIGGSHSTDDISGSSEHAPFSHDDEGCILENVVLRNSSHQQQIQEIPPIILPNVHLYCNIHCFHIPEKIEILHYLKYKPYPEPYFISYVVPALGLRAPPLT